MKYAVIGAGLSGLAAAHRLTKAGHEVVVLETQDQPGGRCKVIKRDGFVIDTGPEIAASTYHHWLALARDMQLTGDLVNAPTLMGIVHHGRIIELDPAKPLAMITTPILSLAGKARMVAGGLRLRTRIKAVPKVLLDGAPLDDLNRTCQDLALEVFGSEVTDRLLEAMLRPIGGTRLDLLSTFILPYTLSEWTRMMSLLGGLQRLPLAIAATLDVRYRVMVDQVQSNPGDVTIALRGPDGAADTMTFDKCLIATQFDDAERIYPRLSEIGNGYSGKMDFLRMMDIKLAYAKRPNSAAGLIMLPFAENKDICLISLTHNKAPDRAPPGHALFSVSTEHLEFDRFNAMSDSELVDVIRPQVEALFPEVVGHLLFTYVGRYSRVSNLPSPGFYHRTRALWDAIGKEPRVHVCGDLFNSGAAMESAVMTGNMAADRLMAN